jgi:hypothetical protein
LADVAVTVGVAPTVEASVEIARAVTINAPAIKPVFDATPSGDRVKAERRT